MHPVFCERSEAKYAGAGDAQYIMPVIQLIIIIVSTAVLTFAIKNITKISRPNNSIVKLRDYAFPSGHTSISFALATFYTFFIFELPIDFISKFLLIAVIFTGVICIVYWRIQIKVHTPVQIFAGCSRCSNFTGGSKLKISYNHYMKIGFDYVGITTPFYCHDGKGNILMHKRTKECRDEHGCWDPGSGKLEFDLSIEENVLQEVLEEYGCKGEIEGGLSAHDIFREHDGQKTHWIAIPFFIKVNPEEVINGEPHKIEEIKWFPINELPEPLHTGFAFALNKYKKEFEEYFVNNKN